MCTFIANSRYEWFFYRSQLLLTEYGNSLNVNKSIKEY